MRTRIREIAGRADLSVHLYAQPFEPWNTVSPDWRSCARREIMEGNKCRLPSGEGLYTYAASENVMNMQHKAGVSMLNRKRFRKLNCQAMMLDVRMLIATSVAVLLLFVFPIPCETAEQKALAPQKTGALETAQTVAPAPVTSGPTTIPVADVATKATEVASELQTITQKLAPSPQIETIRQLLPDVSHQIDEDLAVTTKVLEGQPALPTLQAQQQQWQQIQAKMTGWLADLTKQSNALQVVLDHLSGLQNIWVMTLKAAEDSKAPGPTLQQVNETLAAIREAQIPLKAQLTSVLDLQSSVSGEVAKCGSVVAKIAHIQETSMSGILVQDSLPITNPALWAYSLTGLAERIGNVGTTFTGTVNKYLRDTSEGMSLHGKFLVMLTLLFLAARYQVRKMTASGTTFSPAINVIDHPISAALTVTLLLVTSPYWPVPTVLRRTFQVIAFAPMLVLIRPVVPRRLFPGLSLLWLIVGIDAVREAFSSELLIGQIMLMIESFAGTATVIWFLRSVRPAEGEATGTSHSHLLQTGSVLVLLILASGFVASIMGYMRLARLLTPGIIAGGMLAISLYASLRVLIGIADIAFRVWPLRTFRMVQHNRGLLERRLYLLLVWAAIVAWTIRFLSYVGLLQLAESFGRTILQAKYERGDFSISVSGILEFLITVWAAYLLSAFLRFVLREDVYPRIRVAPGKSYAVSSLLHYIIIALGFVAGIAVLGINLTKLTVLTGALGVGIGFGLQSVVNNFVSGLILLFERPIQAGDTVEVGDLLGKVLRIGIRASTVHTRQGADIIVPNSQLITEKVTNWTLSDMLRRIDLPVGVSYSSTPKEVIKVLERVAIDNPHILADPPPQALFMGYGDSSINFELRAWTDRFDDWQLIRSELATAVFDAVRAAGMSFPFPQREVRILGYPERTAEAHPADPEKVD